MSIRIPDVATVERLYADPRIKDRMDDIFQEVMEWQNDLWRGNPSVVDKQKALAIMLILSGDSEELFLRESVEMAA